LTVVDVNHGETTVSGGEGEVSGYAVVCV